MFGSKDDKNPPAEVGTQAQPVNEEKKSLFSWWRKKPAETAAEAPAPAATATEASVATAATVYKVVAGDSLWKIAEATYGDGLMWSKIAEANTLRNPNVISIGRELQLPAK